MSTQPDPSHRAPLWLVLPAALIASVAVLMCCWQVANLGIGLAVGDYIGELEGLVRVSAAAGAIAMLATLPVARFLLRRARASVWLALLMIPLGAVATYYLVPRVFVYATV
ncbi:MAG: hypothetical protein FJX72_21140 [Armatimonadetes bacterium]|nr:hypothetical protein [Armatimonadota bacterium]